MLGGFTLSWRATLALVGAFLAVSPVAAAECGRTYFVDAYRSAVAAQRKDVGQATAIFRTLAEEGFAPAQRRLGEILLPDHRQEALQWLRLAMQRGDEQAPDSMTAANATADERQAAIAAAKQWFVQDAICMQGFAQNLRQGAPISLKDFIDEIRVSKGVPHSPQEISGRLLGLFFAVFQRDPSFLPYLRAVTTVVIGSTPVAAWAFRQEGRTTLVIDDKMLMSPDPARLKMLLATVVDGVRTNVHDRVEPPAYHKVSHRGRSIVAIGYGDAARALDLIRKGIDLAETLPPDLRRLANVVKDLHYETPPLGVDTKAGATYMRDRKHIWFKRNPDNISPREVAALLAANGVVAEAEARGENTPGLVSSKRAVYEAQRVRDILP